MEPPHNPIHKVYVSSTFFVFFSTNSVSIHNIKFCCLCVLVTVQDYYNILEVEYDATDDNIRLNYRKLALVRLLCFFLVFKIYCLVFLNAVV